MNKKLLFFSLLCLFCTKNLIAGNPVSVKSGEASVLKRSSNALLEIDYSSAIFGEETLDEYLQRRGDDFVKGWLQLKASYNDIFIERFNKKSKRMKLLTDATDASSVSYKFVIHVDRINLGSGVRAALLFPIYSSAGAAIMSGTIDIIDLTTNEIVCTLFVDKVKGTAIGVYEEVRLGTMFYELATIICKLK